jgi:hypothetical protein
MTPGCTTQACDFRDSLASLTKAGYTVLGISPDPVEKLAEFRDLDRLTFPLLSDPDHKVLETYGAYGEKKLYGKTVVGVIRSTFVIDAAQRIGGASHVVGELANEPAQIGMRNSWAALAALGRKVKAVAPTMLLCGGEDNEGRLLVAPFDFADAHLDREHAVQGWQWLKRRLSEHWVIDQPEDQRGKGLPADFVRMPFVAGENRNMGEERADGNRGDGPETQPSVCFGVAALSRARRLGGVQVQQRAVGPHQGQHGGNVL